MSKSLDLSVGLNIWKTIDKMLESYSKARSNNFDEEADEIVFQSASYSELRAIERKYEREIASLKGKYI